MKVKLAVAVLAAFLLLAGTAQAFEWHMRYGQAKHESRAFVEQVCREDRECTGFGVGQCFRISSSRFDCEVGTFYANYPEYGEEMECNLPLHWGVSYYGEVVLKNHGRAHCFQV